MLRRNKPWTPRRGILLTLRRSAVLWWALTLTLALLTASVVGSSVGQATRAARAWGSDRPVWVVRQPVRAGDVISADTVRRTNVPRGVVPEGALDADASPVGEATRVALARGEIVLTGRLAGRGARGVAAMVPPGYRAVALPNDEHTPVAQIGDRVDVIATFNVGDDLASPDSEPAVAVAQNCEVLSVAPRTLTIAVVAADAPRVAFALAKAAVAVVLRGGAVSAPPRPR